MIGFKLRRGFTLVELLIAMLLGSIISVILYGLFSTTSESLGEVTNLSDAQDRGRFAIERLRSDFRAAGSLSSPDSTADAWARPPQNNLRVLGITGYDGWQDDRTELTAAGLAADNPDVSYDGVVVMGALDFPVSFEVRDLKNDTDDQGEIADHVRGLHKLLQLDPFRFSAESNVAVTSSMFDPQWSTRLLRLMDRQGYVQFASMAEDPEFIDGVAPLPGELRFDFESGFLPVFKDPGQQYGIDLNPEGDFAYDAALIDAYWYHVEVDPIDSTNMRLVRERLCARSVVTELATDPLAFDPSTAGPETCPGGAGANPVEKVVIANRVADFQVWFDCTAAAAGASVVGATWSADWLQPTGGECMSDTVYEPNRARVAHVRLALYAPNERKDLRNFQFEDRDGNTGNAALVNEPMVRLRTFDPVPTLEGASAVVTMETSFELPTYVYRNP